MEYRIFYSSQASRYLSRLTSHQAQRILEKIKQIGKKPFNQENNIKKLQGTVSSYRLRIGDIRVIYELIQKEKLIYIVKIAPRGSVHRE